MADGVCCTDGRYMIRVRSQSGVRYVMEGASVVVRVHVGILPG